MKCFRITKKTIKWLFLISIWTIVAEIYHLMEFLGYAIFTKELQDLIFRANMQNLIFMIIGGVILIYSSRSFERKTEKRIFLLWGIWCFSVGFRYLVYVFSKKWILLFLSHWISLIFSIAFFASCIGHLTNLKHMERE